MRVLVTGSTGYVGSRLVPELLRRGCDVHAATRRTEGLDGFHWAGDVTPVAFDLSDESTVTDALRGMDAVVYLVHSMGEGDFVTKDRQAAELVAETAARHDVGRIVYLSGLIPDDAELSAHLESRLQVERVFLGGSVPATVLRAAMLIGSGSTSFEMLRRLSTRLPVTPLPRWMCHTVQPVAVEDAVHLLAGALLSTTSDRHYDIGGPDRVSYPELLTRFARQAGRRRPQVVLPFVPHRVVARLVALVSGMPHGTVAPLVESLGHDLVCRDDEARRDLAEPGHAMLGLDEALRRSLSGSREGTSADGDAQAPAASDPAWSGPLSG